MNARGIIKFHMTIWCGRCAEWRYLEGRNKREGGVQARGVGWAYTRAHGWLCPVCANPRCETCESYRPAGKAHGRCVFIELPVMADDRCNNWKAASRVVMV